MTEVIVSSPMEIETSALTSSGTGPGGGSRRQGLGRSNSVNRKRNEAAPLFYYNSSSRGGGGLFSSLSSLGSLSLDNSNRSKALDNSNRSKSASKLNNNNHTPLNNEELALINMQRNSSRRLNLNQSADDEENNQAQQEAPSPQQQQQQQRRPSAPDRRRRDSMKEINENWKSEYSINISTSLHSLDEDLEEEPKQQKQSFEPNVVVQEGEEGIGVEQTYKISNIATSKRKKKRHHVNVTFDTVTVRFYNTIVGDSPSCPSGPPVSLGWKYDKSLSLININIDMYEDVNTNILNVGNKKDYELVLPRPDREERLLEAGISRTEMAIATQKNSEARNLQTRTILNLQYQKQEEIFESTTRGLQYMMTNKQHSNWLFNEWKTSKEQGYSTEKLTNWIEKQQSKYLKVHDGNAFDDNRSISSRSTFSVLSSSFKTKNNKKRPTSPSNNIPTTIQEKRSSTFTKEQINELKKRPPFGIVQIETTNPIKVVQQGEEEEKQEEEVLSQQQKQPFAKVDYVYMNSPIFMAGIQKGDEILIFGNLSKNSMDYSQGQIGKCIQSQIIIKQQQQKNQKGTGTTTSSSGSSPNTHHNTRGSGRRFNNKNIDDDNGIRVVIQRHNNKKDKSDDDEGEVLTKFVHPSKYEGGPGNLGWLISSLSST